MQPLASTDEALTALSRFVDQDVTTELTQLASRAASLTPGLVGLSLSLLADELTFTFLATDEVTACLDAMQYLDGGPCVYASDVKEPVLADHRSLLDEGRWQLFARSGAAMGVLSTLSLPVLQAGTVTGGVNLYGSEPDTFTGHHRQLASLFGAWAGGAVTNADLSFASRLRADEAPERLATEQTMQIAVGCVMGLHDVSEADARLRLRQAAQRAGVSEAAMASMVREYGVPSSE